MSVKGTFAAIGAALSAILAAVVAILWKRNSNLKKENAELSATSEKLSNVIDVSSKARSKTNERIENISKGDNTSNFNACISELHNSSTGDNT